MNNTLLQVLLRYRPSVQEYHKNALTISKEMEMQLASIIKQVSEGKLTREAGIKALRNSSASALDRLTASSREMYQVSNAIKDMMGNVTNFNALDVTDGAKELLDIAQEVALETVMAIRTIQAQWRGFEVTMKGWVKDIQLNNLK